MKYTISTLDKNVRRDYKFSITTLLNTEEFEEVYISTVDGRDKFQLQSSLMMYGNPPVHYDAKVGQLGRWFTFLTQCKVAAMSEEPLLCFEDDAVIARDFANRFPTVIDETPDDADFLSLFIPRNKPAEIYRHESMGPLTLRTGIQPCYDVGSEVVVRTYQPYGGVALVLYNHPIS